MNIYRTALASIFFLSSTSSRAQAQTPDSKQAKLWDSSLNEARNIVQKTKSKEAGVILKYVESAALISSDSTRAWLFPADAPLEATVLLERNAKYNFYFEKGYVTTLFIPRRNLILVSAQAHLSPTWRGINLLHEGLHAYRLYTKKYSPLSVSDSAAALEELAAYEFECKLILKLGGKKYQALLKQVSNVVKERIALLGGTIENNHLGAWKCPELDTIFGPSQSIEETRAREFHIWAAVHMGLIDTFAKGNKTDLKRKLMQSVAMQKYK